MKEKNFWFWRIRNFCDLENFYRKRLEDEKLILSRHGRFVDSFSSLGSNQHFADMQVRLIYLGHYDRESILIFLEKLRSVNAVYHFIKTDNITYEKKGILPSVFNKQIFGSLKQTHTETEELEHQALVNMSRYFLLVYFDTVYKDEIFAFLDEVEEEKASYYDQYSSFSFKAMIFLLFLLLILAYSYTKSPLRHGSFIFVLIYIILCIFLSLNILLHFINLFLAGRDKRLN